MSNTCSVSAMLPPVGGAAAAVTGNAAMVVAVLPDIVGTVEVLTGEAAFVSATLPPIVGKVAIAGNSLADVLNNNFPQLNAPFVDPKTGIINPAWQRLLMSLWTRTGGANGTLSPYT